MPISFRFRAIPFIAAALAIAIGVGLGQWQMRRAAEKSAVEQLMAQRQAAPVMRLQSTGAKADAGQLEFRRVVLRGQFVADWPVYLDNRPHQGRAGAILVMPFRLAGSSRHVAVERGWIARDPAARTRVAAIAVPGGEIELTGTVRRNAGRLLQLGQAAPLVPGAFVQNLDLGQFSRAAGLELDDFVLEQSSDTGDGLARDWPLPSAGIERHYGYAFQWYALAATAFIFFVVTGFRRGANKPDRSARAG